MNNTVWNINSLAKSLSEEMFPSQLHKFENCKYAQSIKLDFEDMNFEETYESCFNQIENKFLTKYELDYLFNLLDRQLSWFRTKPWLDFVFYANKNEIEAQYPLNNIDFWINSQNIVSEKKSKY